MSGSYDLTKGVFSAKAKEGMIAFAGFQVLGEEGARDFEGVLKVAAFSRSDGNGYLTLTFILDLDGNGARRPLLRARFHRLDQDTLMHRLGPDFLMLLDMPLDPFTESPDFYIEELNLYFHRLAGRERSLLEDWVMPALDHLLDFRFESLEWADQGQMGTVLDSGAGGPVATGLTLKQRLKRWWGAD